MIARTVPHTLKRPGLICVVPRKAAENAGSRYSGPTVWLTLFSEDASRTPARAAIVLQLTRLQNLNLRIRTPERRAASGLAPVAYARLPIGVCSNTYHTITARMSMYTAMMGTPRKDPEVRPVIEGEKGPMNAPLATTAARPVNSDVVPRVVIKLSRPRMPQRNPLKTPMQAPTTRVMTIAGTSPRSARASAGSRTPLNRIPSSEPPTGQTCR